MKTFKFIPFSLAAGIVSGSINHTALAQKPDAKLIVHDIQGAHQLSCAISRKSLIVRAPILTKPHDDSAVIAVGMLVLTALALQPTPANAAIVRSGRLSWRGY